MASDPTRIGLRLVPLVLGVIAAGVLFARGCQEGPFGRPQLVGLTTEQEAQLGAQAYRQVLQKSNVVAEGPAVDTVRRIGRRLAEAATDKDVLQALKLPPQKFAWEFEVIQSGQVNAFCLPGGKVVVYTGILPVAESEAGLATVLGHEIGHALAHHGAERVAQKKLVEIGQQAVAQSLDDMDPERRRQVMGLLGAGSQFGILLPYSRKHEAEADHIGLLLMAAAGYDPRASVDFWRRMGKQSGAHPPEFQSTHPSEEHRAANLKNWLAEAMPLYQKSKAQPARPLPRQ